MANRLIRQELLNLRDGAFLLKILLGRLFYGLHDFMIIYAC